MKKTDLLLILAGKYGNWIIKNPSVMLYARDPEKTLSMLADILNDYAGVASLDWQLRDQLVTADVYFGGGDDDDGT